MGDREEREERPRRLAHREVRAVGERSAALARALMQLGEADLSHLELDPELRAEVDRARAVTARVARRRAERRLSGQLRGADLAALEARLAKQQRAGRADARRFQQVEAWRARLVDGSATVEELRAALGPAADPAALARLVDDARREGETGKPRGAARALFRALMAASAGGAGRG